MQQAQSFTLSFVHKRQLAKDTFSFFFNTENIDFDFLPGQYVRMTIPHHAPDDRGTSRYFTIASAPHEKEHLMITTKLYQSSFKEALHNLAPGQQVQLFGPIGKFILDESDLSPRVFIAGGVGITPFYSMIRSALHKQLSIPITLIVSFAGEEDMFFIEELAALAATHSQFTLIMHFSEKQGRLTEKHLSTYIGHIDQQLFSIVGSPTMVRETNALLQKITIREEQIQTEDFTGYF